MEDLIKNRAWIEINLDNLRHNISEIKKIISKDTKIMAVVKANAYGHGLVKIALELNKLGIMDFAVASLDEGIALRKNNIKGNILILGYTHYDYLKYCLEYDLIQTIVDEEYASNINYLDLKVHLKINTGMNRLGINYNHIDEIIAIYNRLNVKGIYSHLCVADSLKEEDVAFTNMQIERFNNVIDLLKRRQINVGVTHLQSSYGIVNYPSLKYDYVRLGIMLYGVNSIDDLNYKNVHIKPVLSIKARISSVKTISINETVGYGRTFKSNQNKKIASVSIGYGDGYPRNLSNIAQEVMVNGKKAKIIGLICMDQLMIDVSDIFVLQNDIVTLVGDGISVEDICKHNNSITNEFLSRLSTRLPYLYINN